MYNVTDGVQRPGSNDAEQMSEKDQRQAASIIDAFDITVVSHLLTSVMLMSYVLI